SQEDLPVERIPDGWLIPVKSVGVQGDCRSYAPVLAISAAESRPLDHARATELINRISGINRVITCVRSMSRLEEMRVLTAALTSERLSRLRTADAIVRRLSHESGFDRRIWQFPVVLIPVGTPGRPDSVVLRPVDS